MSQRTTRQLSAVLEAVRAGRDHPTAQAVYERVRRRIPTISRGTIYRNLNKLERKRELRTVRLADGPVLYDAALDDHDHFVCERCGGIRDLTATKNRCPQRTELGEAGYIVNRRSVTYYGLCPRCVPDPGRLRTDDGDGL